MSPPRLIQVAEYARSRGGSFVPMLLDTLESARTRGWRIGAVFPEEAREAPWIEDFTEIGAAPRFAAAEARSGRARWLEAELRDEPGPTILHTHFTGWDVPAALAARRLDSAAVIWHVHTTLGKTPAAVLRNVAKFATLGRGVAAILCPAPNIADDVSRRLAPRGRVHFLPSVVDVEGFPLLDPGQRLQSRTNLGIAPEATVLLHFGWHWHLKGGDIFMATVKDMVEGGRRGSGRD